MQKIAVRALKELKFLHLKINNEIRMREIRISNILTHSYYLKL